MNRQTQSLLLLLLGGAILKISIGDAYLLYVKPGLRPWLIVSGVLLVLLAIGSLVDDLRRTRVPAAAGGAPAEPAGHAAHAAYADDSDDHRGHAHGGSRVGWLLLLPVLAIFLVAPPALGAYSAERGDSRVAKPESTAFPPLPAGDPVTVALTDYAARSMWDSGASLQGRTVELVGFVTPAAGELGADGGYYVTRLVMSCCAADASPIRVYVDGDAGTFAADQWIAVVGTFGTPVEDPEAGYRVPVVKASSVDHTDQPAVPYEQ